ncbi:TetR/AcrR family transcriptional regulator [Salinispora arenicola]|uniref:TetR/AcrR family transcriptional regulator n=1 Tax=Salinispora arenicola TaxID=168697 RepID=UPI00037B1EC4|nr:TetR/AcrR family transcriptional regulator [Salinispora arenicola]
MSATPHRGDQQTPAKTRNEDGRTARSRSTRRRITTAATELFTTAGYSSTSVAAIAARAGVSEQSVYYSFGTKRAILTAALDLAIAGDDEPVPTLERPWVRAALADPDPHGQIRRQVAGAADVYRRAAPLLDVVRSAATIDAELAEVWATNLQQRLTVQRVFAEALARKTSLPAGMTVDTAADTGLAILSPETYHLLVHHQGWEHTRWRDWATNALHRLLTTLP